MIEGFTIEKLAEYLVKAKKSTYASGKKAVKLPTGEKEFVFKRGLWTYRDGFYENDPKPFIGQEIIKFKDIPVWGMSYYGWVLPPCFKITDKIYSFLKEALSNVDEGMPFRGPNIFRKENFLYVNDVTGSIEKFRNGFEKIYFSEKIEEEKSKSEIEQKATEAYNLHYQGGLLINQ